MHIISKQAEQVFNVTHNGFNYRLAQTLLPTGRIHTIAQRVDGSGALTYDDTVTDSGWCNTADDVSNAIYAAMHVYDCKRREMYAAAGAL